jgi:hypothetical protein
MPSPPPLDAAALSRRLADLQELLREAAEIAIATGPRGIARSAQAASALLSVARDQAVRLQAGQQPEGPAVVLRKLFERLGATYVKLGQFVASRCGGGGGSGVVACLALAGRMPATCASSDACMHACTPWRLPTA